MKHIPPKKCVGPSNISSILGYNKWCSKETLKTNIEQGYYDTPNENMLFGIQHEAVCRKFYEKYKKIKVADPPFVRACNNRLIGKADGLISNDGGLEIKCHNNKDALQEIPLYYMCQIVAYMYLYQRPWWDFMSCSFENGKLKKCHIRRVYWKNHKDTWEQQWLPQIVEFINSVKWCS